MLGSSGTRLFARRYAGFEVFVLFFFSGIPSWDVDSRKRKPNE
jgi:hypothetical protein